jgi:hypothetical protein
MNINSVIRIHGGAVGSDGVRSPWPRVDDATGRITFRAEVEIIGEELYLRGSFNNWGVDPAYKMTLVP